MVNATMIPPQSSYSNPDPVNWPTGFRHTAHVPPQAIGPQFAGNGIGADAPVPLFLPMLLALGVGTMIYFATRGPRRGDLQGTDHQRRFGHCARWCSRSGSKARVNFTGCMKSCLKR